MSLSDSDERVITEGEIASCREQMSFTSSSTRMHRDKHDKFHHILWHKKRHEEKFLPYALRNKIKKVTKPLRGKILGTDGITSDIIKVGGNPVTQTEKLINLNYSEQSVKGLELYYNHSSAL